jgi:uncharacterized membrane protein
MTTMNPFDLKTALLARHAQHVVLVHFPIALFITGVAFDVLALWKKSRTLAAAAYYNLLGAAISAVPTVATGLLAWQLLLGGARLRGNLRLHVILALLSTAAIWLVWSFHFRAQRKPQPAPHAIRLAVEFAAVAVVALTGHVGGFLSGVNGPG